MFFFALACTEYITLIVQMIAAAAVDAAMSVK